MKGGRPRGSGSGRRSNVPEIGAYCARGRVRAPAPVGNQLETLYLSGLGASDFGNLTALLL